MDFTLSSDSLLAVAGVVVSLLCSYMPGLATWYNGLASDLKRVVMLLVLLMVTAGIFTAGCAGLISGVDCSQAGGAGFLRAFIAALIANQAADRISPRVGSKGG